MTNIKEAPQESGVMEVAPKPLSFNQAMGEIFTKIHVVSGFSVRSRDLSPRRDPESVAAMIEGLDEVINLANQAKEALSREVE